MSVQGLNKTRDVLKNLPNFDRTLTRGPKSLVVFVITASHDYLSVEFIFLFTRDT